MTEDALDFLIQRYQMLPEDTVGLLKLASCIGFRFNLETLGIISKRSLRECADLLYPAMEKGVLLSLNHHYRSADADSYYQFSHDKIQQAIYQLLDRAQRSVIHLSIARLWYSAKKNTLEKDPEQLFAITQQFYTAAQGMTRSQRPFSNAEQLIIAALSNTAAQKAAASNNYRLSYLYGKYAKSLLKKDAWQAQYDLTCSIYQTLITAAFYQQHYPETERLSDILFQRVTTTLERQFILRQKIIQKSLLAENEACIKLVYRYLSLVNFKFPRNPKLYHFLKLYLRHRWLKRKLTKAQCLTNIVTSDPSLLELVDIIRVAGPALMNAGNSFIIGGLIMALLNHCIKQGFPTTAAFLCLAASATLLPKLKDFSTMLFWREIGLEILKSNTDPQIKISTLYLEGWHLIGEWKIFDQERVDYFKAIYQAGLQCGELLFSGYAAIESMTNNQYQQKKLYEIYIPSLQAFGNKMAYQTNQLQYGMILGQLGLSKIGDFSRPGFDAKAYYKYIMETPDTQFLRGHYWRTENECYLFVDPRKSYRAGKKYWSSMQNDLYAWATGISMLYAFLSISQYYMSLHGRERRLANKHMKWLYTYVKKITPYCPRVNSVEYIMKGELERIKQHPAKALNALKIALNTSINIHHTYLEAMCYQLIGDVYHSLGKQNEIFAGFAYQEALVRYQVLGYIRRAKMLQDKSAHALVCAKEARYHSDILSSQATGEPTTIRNLDLQGLLNSARLLFSEVSLKWAVERFFIQLLKHTGADNGAILMDLDEQWQVVAYGNINHQTVLPEVTFDQIKQEDQQVAKSVLTQLIREEQMINLVDIARDSKYQNDTYLKSASVKSLLCIPMHRNSKLRGIIYLESKNTAGAFDASKIEFIQALSAQAIISLENSKLYEDLLAVNRAYERFVPKEFLKLLAQKQITKVHLGDSVAKDMTILFLDIRDFTKRAEQLTPSENFKFINVFLSTMEPIIHRHNGFIDKYIGDAIMALFPNQVDDALHTALEMIEQLQRLNEKVFKDYPVNLGIGINYGSLMLGIVGSESRNECTVISDAVNVAARVQALNKEFKTQCLITEMAWQAVKDQNTFDVKKLTEVTVRGKAKGFNIYCFRHSVTPSLGRKPNDS